MEIWFWLYGQEIEGFRCAGQVEFYWEKLWESAKRNAPACFMGTSALWSGFVSFYPGEAELHGGRLTAELSTSYVLSTGYVLSTSFAW